MPSDSVGRRLTVFCRKIFEREHHIYLYKAIKLIGLSILVTYLLITFFSVVGCSKVDSSNSRVGISPTTPVITSSPNQNGNVGLNPQGFISSADLAAANTEASEIKSILNAFFSETGSFPSTSDELIPKYFNKNAKAKYYFNSVGIVRRVDSVPSGWSFVVFSISQQKWVEGSPDNNHENDQDVP